MKYLRTLFIVTLFSMLFATAGVKVNAQEIQQYLVSSGNVEMNGEGLQMTGSFGQPIVGRTGSGNRELGQGFWYGLSQAQNTSNVEEERVVAQNAGLHLSVLPNPILSTGTVRITFPSSREATLKLYDPLGRSVLTLVDGNAFAGTTDVELDVNQLEAGHYRLVLQTEGLRLIEPLVVMK